MITSEQLGTVYSFDFQFTSLPNVWLATDVTIGIALDCIKTGLLHNQPVSKIKMFSINSDGTSVSFVYDVNAAKSGNFPWSLTNS
jgi:hypothetical protein